MNLESIPWIIAESEYENNPLLIRFREFPEGFPRFNYPKRLNIFWQMKEFSEFGLPDEAESNRLEIFENRLIDAVEFDSCSILTVVLTCNRQREYVFYAADTHEFLKRLTNMPQENDRYPISIHQYEDPEWNYFNSVV